MGVEKVEDSIAHLLGVSRGCFGTRARIVLLISLDFGVPPSATHYNHHGRSGPNPPRQKTGRRNITRPPLCHGGRDGAGDSAKYIKGAKGPSGSTHRTLRCLSSIQQNFGISSKLRSATPRGSTSRTHVGVDGRHFLLRQRPRSCRSSRVFFRSSNFPPRYGQTTATFESIA